MMRIETHSEEETVAAGREYSRRLQPGDVVACFGGLGAGKTRFIKGICEGLGVREHVSSPTFTIVHEYHVRELHICHFDFYRLKSLGELREIGFEEYFDGKVICLIEWADKVSGLLPQKRCDVRFALGSDEQTREIIIDQPVGIVA